ncbi:hypothetical protein ECC02_004343 [Trypanosoma cruzi]|uniref:Transmembrane protein n=1 Tax=Trypanosoma cruzi TaxID=5693 RepID=A0A7J6Y7X4_TRYCR|nr:hypothetical protein ECC02_004343 [Trypanosoma cruzi]
MCSNGCGVVPVAVSLKYRDDCLCLRNWCMRLYLLHFCLFLCLCFFLCVCVIARMWTSNNFCALAFNLYAPFLFSCLPDFLHPFLFGCVCFGCSAALWVMCINSLCPCCSDWENTLWVRVHGSVVAALFFVVALRQPRQDCQRVALGCLVGLFSASCAMDSYLRRTLSCSGLSATRWQFCCCCCFSCLVFPSGIVRCRCRTWRQ